MSPRVRTGVIAAGVVALFVLGLGVFILPFAYPTPPPIVSRFTATRLFSPNDDARREVARVSVRLVVPSRVTILIRDGDGDVVKTLLDDAPRRRGWVRLSWEGRGDDGRPAADGRYRLELRVRRGKKRFNVSRRIEIDTQAPLPTGLQVTSAVVDGAGDGQCRLSVTADGAGSLTLEAFAVDGEEAVARLGPRPIREDESVRWAWDGAADLGGPVPPGLYRLRASIGDATGNREARERTCWVGHLVGRPNPSRPAPGDRVGVRLADPDGRPLDPAARVELALYRRAATPGRGRRDPLGARVAGRASGPHATVSVRLPKRLRPDALWLVASTPTARALIALEPAP